MDRVILPEDILVLRQELAAALARVEARQATLGTAPEAQSTMETTLTAAAGELGRK